MADNKNPATMIILLVTHNLGSVSGQSRTRSGLDDHSVMASGTQTPSVFSLLFLLCRFYPQVRCMVQNDLRSSSHYVHAPINGRRNVEGQEGCSSQWVTSCGQLSPNPPYNTLLTSHPTWLPGHSSRKDWGM